MRAWYGGCRLTKSGGTSRVTLEAYNPRSVARAAASGAYGCFWGQAEKLSGYLHRDVGGLDSKMAGLVDGERAPARLGSILGDLVTLTYSDDAIAPLVHLASTTRARRPSSPAVR